MPDSGRGLPTNMLMSRDAPVARAPPGYRLYFGLLCNIQGIIDLDA